LFGWRPIRALVVLAALVLGVPAARMAAGRFGAGEGKDAVSVDTGGAEGRIDGDQFRIDLPLAISNRTDSVVIGVELWTMAWACPSAIAPVSRCRRLVSTGQDFAMRLMPDGSAQFPTVLTGGVPAGAGGTDSVRIERQLENVYDDRDMKRAAQQAEMH